MDNREAIDWDHCTALVCCILGYGGFSPSSIEGSALDTFPGSLEHPIPTKNDRRMFANLAIQLTMN